MDVDEAPSRLPKIEDELEEQPKLTAITSHLDATRGDLLILGVSPQLEDNSWLSMLSLGERLGHGACGDVEIMASASVIHRLPFTMRKLVRLHGAWRVIVYIT